MGETSRSAAPSDALVLFGVTGDLAHKMIFPALYAMVKRGVLDVPVVGVAFSGWSLAQLRRRAADGIRKAGRIDDVRALRRLLSLLRYVDGDYNDPGTFAALKRALGGSRRPAHYLAIPRCGPGGPREGHRREALRPRPGLRAQAQSRRAVGVPGGGDLPDRSLPR